MPNYVAGPPYPRGLYAGNRGFSFGALTARVIAASPGGLVRAAGGIVTVTTSAPHLFLLGEIVTIVGSTSVNGTRFDGNYIIKTIPGGSSFTALPVDDILLHQAADTGGVGTANSIAMEQPAPPQAGAAFGLTREPVKTFCYAFGKFDGAPGAFEVDLQLSDVDVDSEYQTAAGMNVTTVDATNNTFRAAIQDQANFVRMFLKSRANAVNFAGWFTA